MNFLLSPALKTLVMTMNPVPTRLGYMIDRAGPGRAGPGRAGQGRAGQGAGRGLQAQAWLDSITLWSVNQ